MFLAIIEQSFNRFGNHLKYPFLLIEISKKLFLKQKNMQ